MNNVVRRVKETKTEYELGRYKKKVEDQQKEIQELKAQLEGYQQVMEMDQAIIGAVLLIYSVDKNRPVEIKKEAITRMMDEIRVCVEPTEDGYKMHYERIEEAGA